MKSNPFLEKYGACLVAAVLFIAASVIYCFPALQGKKLTSVDNVNARCAASETHNWHEETGKVTWWCDSMFSGMPNYHIKGGQFKADRWLSPLTAVLHRGQRNPIWAFLLYFVCFFLLAWSLGLDKWLSIAGAFALTLSSYFVVIIAAGHNTKTAAIALMCAVLAGFFLLLRGKHGAGALVTLLGAAAGITLHPQMSYYIFLLAGLLWICLAPGYYKERRMKQFLVATGLFAACVGVGLMANASSVFVNAEYAKESVRSGPSELAVMKKIQSKGTGESYVTDFSYGPLESFSLLIPGVTGGASSIDAGAHSRYHKTMLAHRMSQKDARNTSAHAPLYWGEQPFTEGNVYVGAVICFLFLLGALILRGGLKWGLVIATILSVALALGKHFMVLTRFFLDYFPYYSKFRSVSSILVVAEIAMPLLGLLGVQAILDGKVEKDKLLRGIKISALVTAGICLLFALFGPSLFSFTSQSEPAIVVNAENWFRKAVIDGRKAMLVGDSLRSAAFIAVAAGLLLLFAKGKFKKAWLVPALGLLIVLDLWPVDRRYFGNGRFVAAADNSAAYAMQDWEKQILQDPGFFRVFNLTGDSFNEARTSLRLHSLGGYNAAKLRRYQDLIEGHLTKSHIPVISMLNAKYLIVKDEGGKPEVKLNRDAMGNAWFVEQCMSAADPPTEDAALTRLDLRTKAIVDIGFASLVKYPKVPLDPDRSIELTAHTPDSREYRYTSIYPGTVVFSEIYYPYGWKASIDGEPVEHFRANYVLRALCVPAGTHTIRFVFDPDSVRKGDRLALPFIILMYLAVAFILGWGIWKRVRKK